MQDQRLAKWDRWLEAIYSDVQGILVHRYVFHEVGAIVQANSKIQKPSAFFDLIGQGYAAMGAMAVRRQVKIHKDSISLGRLLEEMEQTPKIISRKWYLSHYEAGSTPMQLGLPDKEFDRYSGTVKDHLDPTVPAGDLSILKSKVASVESYADQHVAHLDKAILAKGNKKVATYNELDECLDLLEDLIKKYYLLFRAIGVPSITPTIVYDWKAVFREAWISMKTENV